VHGMKKLDVNKEKIKSTEFNATLKATIKPEAKCRNCKCEDSYHSDLYSNNCSLKRTMKSRKVCHGCTHCKPHYFSEYMHCNKYATSSISAPLSPTSNNNQRKESATDKIASKSKVNKSKPKDLATAKRKPHSFPPGPCKGCKHKSQHLFSN
jgi:hypothetical protein